MIDAAAGARVNASGQPSLHSIHPVASCRRKAAAARCVGALSQSPQCRMLIPLQHRNLMDIVLTNSGDTRVSLPKILCNNSDDGLGAGLPHIGFAGGPKGLASGDQRGSGVRASRDVEAKERTWQCAA